MWSCGHKSKSKHTYAHIAHKSDAGQFVAVRFVPKMGQFVAEEELKILGMLLPNTTFIFPYYYVTTILL